jgi:hypothetical protein
VDELRADHDARQDAAFDVRRRPAEWNLVTESVVPPHLVDVLRRIESIERLEVLLFCRADPGRSFSAKAVASALHRLPGAVERDLALLCGRGFLAVNIGTDLNYSYKPMNRETDEALAEIEAVYRRSPGSIRALYAPPSDPVRAFADAFRLRKDDDDDA